VAEHRIPRTIPEALLEGFEWDADGRRYHTLGDLDAYAARVAGTVGVMMALLMGQRDRAVLARACDLGVAMQLTNIARDVGEDARAGRLYLPAQWLLEAGIDPQQWLQQPVFSAALGSVIQRLLQEADGLYARASVGIGWLPRACQPGMHAARLLYAEIGNEVQRRQLDSVSSRAHVSTGRKLQLLGRASLCALRRRQALDGHVLEQVRFLVEAVPVETAQAAWARGESQGRVDWMLELFARLEREERQQGNRPTAGQSASQG
jgi:phytoene synthase